jgi:hypothetical protein
VENDLRSITVEVGLDLDNLTLYNAAVATSNASNIMSFVGSFQGPTVIAGSTYPELNVSLPNLSIEKQSAPLAGPGIIVQTVTGTALLSGSDALATIAYTTTDATP